METNRKDRVWRRESRLETEDMVGVLTVEKPTPISWNILYFPMGKPVIFYQNFLKISLEKI